MNAKLAVLITIGLIESAGQIHAAPISFQSTENRTAFLEVYTSEGCSSCPPAEAWLSKLKDSPGLWRDFVPVAFHVDYWDYLGWRDRWGAQQFAARQRAYAQSWGSGTIYTPGFILNGSEWRNRSSHESVPKAAGKAGILTVTSEDTNRWQVSFAPATQGQRKFEVYAALLVSGVSSDVKAGENEGRRLDHDFIVLSLAKESLSNCGGSFQTELTLAAKKQTGAERLGLAVWVTPANRLEPLQAVGAWIDR